MERKYDSKYTGKNSIKNNHVKLERILSKGRLKKLKICEEKHPFCSDKYSQKYFPRVSKMFPVLQQNSLCFPSLEKVRTKFPVYLVPWPPCSSVHLRIWRDVQLIFSVFMSRRPFKITHFFVLTYLNSLVNFRFFGLYKIFSLLRSIIFSFRCATGLTSF